MLCLLYKPIKGVDSVDEVWILGKDSITDLPLSSLLRKNSFDHVAFMGLTHLLRASDVFFQFFSFHLLKDVYVLFHEWVNGLCRRHRRLARGFHVL